MPKRRLRRDVEEHSTKSQPVDELQQQQDIEHTDSVEPEPTIDLDTEQETKLIPSPVLKAQPEQSPIPSNPLPFSPPENISKQNPSATKLKPTVQKSDSSSNIFVPHTLPTPGVRRRSQGGLHGMTSPTGAGISQSFSPSRKVQHGSFPSFAENLAGGFRSSPGTNYSTSHSGRSSAHGINEQAYTCTFDVLDDTNGTWNTSKHKGHNGAPLISGSDVMCSGWDGGVDVWKMGRTEVELLGRMSGLTGAVIGAKILPTPARDDPNAALRPLICLTIHSPIVDNPMTSKPGTAQERRPLSPLSDRFDTFRPVAKQYQTSVEIYSLSQKCRVATLLKSAPIPGYGDIPKPMQVRVEVTAVSGQGNIVAISQWGSGELYVFASFSDGIKRANMNTLKDGEWRCTTKVWTIVQPDLKASSVGSEGHLYDHSKSGMPIFSLEGRWLAYSPPVPASPQAAYYASKNNTHTDSIVCVPCPSLPALPPPQPPSNAFLDVPEDEGLMNRVAREVTQEVIRGARWIGETGMRAVKNYWSGYNPSGASPPPPGIRIGPGGGSGVSVLGMQVQEMRERERELASLGSGNAFGTAYYTNSGNRSPTSLPGGSSPTLAPQSNEPIIISIIDLAKPSMTQKGESYTPLVSFQPTTGLSFLSFGPSGLALLSVSYKGDVVHVWDLMKALHEPATAVQFHGKPGKPDSKGITLGSSEAVNGRLVNGQHAGRHVRQIARFTRMTVAHVVDVSWSRPIGNRVAILTEKGTVHFYDMPVTAYQWPPQPRRSLAAPVQGVGGIVNSASQAAASLLATTQPLVVAATKRRASSGGSGGNSVGHDSSLGVSAGTHNQAANNGHRISLPPARGPLSRGCVQYLGGREQGHVAVMAGGYLRIYENKAQVNGGRRKSIAHGGVVASDWLEYEVPPVPSGVATGVIGQQSQNEDDDDDQPKQMTTVDEPLICTGFWGASITNNRQKDLLKQYVDNPLSFAELESSAPFPPIHSNRHIKLSTFADDSVFGQGNWVFGQIVSCVKLDIGSARGEVEFKDGSDQLLAEAIDTGLKLDTDGAMTSANAAKSGRGRKKKRGVDGLADITGGASPGVCGIDEGFFEDDCEVLDDLWKANNGRSR